MMVDGVLTFNEKNNVMVKLLQQDLIDQHLLEDNLRIHTQTYAELTADHHLLNSLFVLISLKIPIILVFHIVIIPAL
jgi:hypothetical protein